MSAAPALRVLFFTKILTLPRFEDVVLELVRRGAEVVIAAPSTERERSLPEALGASGRIRFERYDELAPESPGRAAEVLRRARDYVWYLAPAHEVASFNRRRALDRLVEVAFARSRARASWPDPLLKLAPDAQENLDRLLGELDDGLAPDPGVVRFLAAERPDVVLVTPLVRPRLHQTEVVKAARLLGIPSAFPVYSWDALSNKGRIHARPDEVYAWNEVHRREAVDLHGMEPGRVVVTGAPLWDGFFTLEPSASREAFCEHYGFHAGRPIVLYLSSTRTVCPDELPVIERWLDAVRAGPEPARGANVLVRPHPGLSGWPKSWAERVPRRPGVAVSDGLAKGGQSLFDELHHADVAVALNTTAEIEASILGTPVYTFSSGELAPGQEGTLHFYHLLEGHGGVAIFSRTLEEHADALAGGLRGEYDADAIRSFCERTVRPLGLDRPVSPIVADRILELAGAPDAAGPRREARL